MAAQPPRLLNIDERVDGKLVSDYPALWWQWANRERRGTRPFQDPSGAQCMLNQSGPVWFLAGTDGTDSVTRQCTVPLGKYLFLPVITMIGNSLPGKAKTCAEAKAFAAANNDHLARAEVEIDGKRVEGIAALRIASRECFDAYPVAPYLTNPRSYYPAATDGYWLMLAPLSAGAHTIKVEARYDNPGGELGDLEQEFEYELRVAPEDEPKQAAPKAFEGLIVGQRVPVPELT